MDAERRCYCFELNEVQPPFPRLVLGYEGLGLVQSFCNVDLAEPLVGSDHAQDLSESLVPCGVNRLLHARSRDEA